MEINIKPEDIDRYVKQSILDSTVGKTLTIEIEKGIKDMMSNWNNPVKAFMNKILEEFVREYMEKPEVKTACLEAITRVITPETVQAVVKYGVTELTRKYNNSDA